LKKEKAIFICIHNSARSQMAQGYLAHFSHDRFEVYSAGLTPGKLNQTVVEAMKLDGIDISKNQTNSVDEYIEKRIIFDFVITVCDEISTQRCPYFPGQGQRLNWSFEDPSSFEMKNELKLKKTIEIRDQIKSKIENFINSHPFV
jgi:arsenate reductase (thioredoxin)